MFRLISILLAFFMLSALVGCAGQGEIDVNKGKDRPIPAKK